MKTVFVILGENGEYSQRSVFISGVFETRAEAERIIHERSEQYRLHEIWRAAHQKNFRRNSAWTFPLNPTHQIEWDAADSAAREAAGPEPEYEPAEHVQIFEVPLGIWQAKQLVEIQSLPFEER